MYHSTAFIFKWYFEKSVIAARTGAITVSYHDRCWIDQKVVDIQNLDDVPIQVLTLNDRLLVRIVTVY